MKIAVLNECFLTDEHKRRLEIISGVSYYTDTHTEDQAIERLQGVDIAFGDMFTCNFSPKVLENAKSLKLLCINSIASHLIDKTVARNLNISIANTPAFCVEAVAEYTFLMAQAVTRKFLHAVDDFRVNAFEFDPGNPAHGVYQGIDLYGKIFGIYGYGAIGAHAAKIAQGYGMNVIVHTRTQRSLPDGMKSVSLLELLETSDIVSLHAATEDSNRKAFNIDKFKQMKPTTYLVNSANNGLIVSEDLAQALNDGVIAGAALDVLDGWKNDHPLRSAKNCLITPHVAGFTKEAYERLGTIMVSNVEQFLAGKLQNIVN